MKKLMALAAAALMAASLAACTPQQKKSVNDAFNRVDRGVRKDIKNLSTDEQSTKKQEEAAEGREKAPAPATEKAQ